MNDQILYELDGKVTPEEIAAVRENPDEDKSVWKSCLEESLGVVTARDSKSKQLLGIGFFSRQHPTWQPRRFECSLYSPRKGSWRPNRRYACELCKEQRNQVPRTDVRHKQSVAKRILTRGMGSNR